MNPPNYPPLISYLAVHDAARAIEFYKAAFAATELYRLCDSGSGRVGHAELALNGSMIMLSDEFYGYRCGSVRDPFGHEWMLQHEIEKVSPAEMQKRWDTMVKDCQTPCAD